MDNKNIPNPDWISTPHRAICFDTENGLYEEVSKFSSDRAERIECTSRDGRVWSRFQKKREISLEDLVFKGSR